VSRSAEDSERLKEFRTRSGIVAAPDPCARLLHGLDTLEDRVLRQSKSAAELAGRLESHPAVEIVRYAGMGGLLSFDVAGAEEARQVETSLRLITNATSLGGVHSLLEARARWEGDRVPAGLLRLSVGLEPVDDLWQDLAQALEIPGNSRARE
jgi:cystathionine gamma-synthase